MNTPSNPLKRLGWGRSASDMVAARAARLVESVRALPHSGMEAARKIGSDREGGWTGRSLILAVVLPTVIYVLYALLWQSSGYVAESRVTVRNAQERVSSSDASSLVGKLSGGAKSSTQDSYIVLSYVKSGSIIADLGGAAYLEKYYSTGGVDYFSRLERNAQQEDLLKYWLKRINASVDTISGIVTLKIEAFHPEDASAIAKDVVRLGEKLVNDITLRSRMDAVARDEREVSLAADKLAAARDRLAKFRNENFLVDPKAKAEGISELVNKLMSEKLSIENSLATLNGVIDDRSPVQRVQRAKLAVIDQQIAQLKKGLTDPGEVAALSSQIASYERLKLEEQFSERMYTISQNAYVRARQELEKQQLYLIVVVPPSVPQQATYPRVFASALMLFTMLFVFWVISVILAATIEDQTI